MAGPMLKRFNRVNQNGNATGRWLNRLGLAGPVQSGPVFKTVGVTSLKTIIFMMPWKS